MKDFFKGRYQINAINGICIMMILLDVALLFVVDGIELESGWWQYALAYLFIVFAAWAIAKAFNLEQSVHGHPTTTDYKEQNVTAIGAAVAGPIILLCYPGYADAAKGITFACLCIASGAGLFILNLLYWYGIITFKKKSNE